MKKPYTASVKVEVETSRGITELEFQAADRLRALAIAKEKLREAHARVFHQWYRKLLGDLPHEKA